jgi:hypothetical protein
MFMDIAKTWGTQPAQSLRFAYQSLISKILAAIKMLVVSHRNGNSPGNANLQQHKGMGI